MPWPAWWGERDEAGTCYVPDTVLRQAAEGGQACRGWRWGAEWRTVELRRGRILKLARPWRAEGQWRQAMADAQRADLRPPSSAASAINALLVQQGVRSRCVATLRYWGPAEVPGGWEAIAVRGPVVGPLYWYDLRSAYVWAAGEALPRPGAIRRTDDWTAPRGLWVLRARWEGDPRPWAVIASRVWTWEERDRWGVDAPPVPWTGLTWSPADEVSIRPALDAIATAYPALWALGRRGFWGAWAARCGPEMIGFRSETRRALPNPYANPIWASLVTARVRLRCERHWRARAQAVQVYVDSLLTRQPLEDWGEPIGEQPGQWRALDRFDGAEIRAPGVWRGYRAHGAPVVRSAGTPRRTGGDGHAGGSHGEAEEDHQGATGGAGGV